MVQQKQGGSGSNYGRVDRSTNEVGKASSLVFLPKFQRRLDAWGRNLYGHVEQNGQILPVKLKDQKLEDVKPVLFDLRFVNQVKP